MDEDGIRKALLELQAYIVRMECNLNDLELAQDIATEMQGPVQNIIEALAREEGRREKT